MSFGSSSCAPLVSQGSLNWPWGARPVLLSIRLTIHAGQQAKKAVAGALHVVSGLLMMLSPPNMQPASPEVKRKPRRTLSWPDMRQEDSGGADLERPPGPTY